MNNKFKKTQEASSLVMSLVVMALLATMALMAYEVTANIGRNTRRIAIRQQAMSVADSSLELLYAQFKSMFDTYNTSLGDLSPNATYCRSYLGFKTTNSLAPLGAVFPELRDYFSSVSQTTFNSLRLDDSSVGIIKTYSVVPLDRYGRVSDSSGPVQTVTPVGSFEGRAFRYLATVDVELPVFGGEPVRAHVSRVFEYQVKSFLNYAIFSNVNLELHPGAAMVITGPVHSNANIYVGAGGASLTFTDSVSCSGTAYVGSMTKSRDGVDDPEHSESGSNVSGTGWANRSNNATAVTPMGVTSTSLSTSDSNPNNDSYHEVVETAINTSTYADPFSPNDSRSNTTTQAFDSAELQTMRFANVADFVVTISNSSGGKANTAGDHITISYVSTTDDSTMVTLDSAVAADYNSKIFQAFLAALKVDSSFVVDKRESASSTSYTAVNLTTLDVAALKTALDSSALSDVVAAKTGLGLYIVDNRSKATYTSAANPRMNSGSIFPAMTGTMQWGSVKLTGTSKVSGTYTATEAALRLVNGSALPDGGLTIVSPNPVYIQGDYNTGSPIVNGTVAYSPAAATGTTWGVVSGSSSDYIHDSTTVTLEQANSANANYYGNYSVDGKLVDGSSTTYYWEPAAIVADAVTVLSNNWSDSNSNLALSSRVASAATTINAAFVSGNVATSSSSYSGGIENFSRLMEDWSNKNFNYVGSLILMYNSTQATGYWNKAKADYSAAKRRWAYDKNFMNFGVPLLSSGGSSTGGAAGGGSRKTVAGGGGKCFQRKQFISRTIQ